LERKDKNFPGITSSLTLLLIGKGLAMTLFAK